MSKRGPKGPRFDDRAELLIMAKLCDQGWNPHQAAKKIVREQPSILGASDDAKVYRLEAKFRKQRRDLMAELQRNRKPVTRRVTAPGLAHFSTASSLANSARAASVTLQDELRTRGLLQDQVRSSASVLEEHRARLMQPYELSSQAELMRAMAHPARQIFDEIEERRRLMLPRNLG
jgi:hypothetical protein